MVAVVSVVSDCVVLFVLIQTSREIRLSSINLPPKFVSTHYNHVENTDIHSYAMSYNYISFLWYIHVGKIIFRLFDVLSSCLLILRPSED